MWHIPSFEIVHKTKGLFLVWPLGGPFLAFKLRLLEFVLSLLGPHLRLAKSVVGILSQLRLTFSILESQRENKPPKIRMIDEAKKRWFTKSIRRLL